MSIREYLPKVDSFNARLAAVEKTLAALYQERDILRSEGGDYMFVTEADKQLGRLSWKITMPENYQPPAQAAKQAEELAPIIRHTDKAAALESAWWVAGMRIAPSRPLASKHANPAKAARAMPIAPRLSTLSRRAMMPGGSKRSPHYVITDCRWPRS